MGHQEGGVDVEAPLIMVLQLQALQRHMGHSHGSRKIMLEKRVQKLTSIPDPPTPWLSLHSLALTLMCLIRSW